MSSYGKISAQIDSEKFWLDSSTCQGAVASGLSVAALGTTAVDLAVHAIGLDGMAANAVSGALGGAIAGRSITEIGLGAASALLPSLIGGLLAKKTIKGRAEATDRITGVPAALR